MYRTCFRAERLLRLQDVDACMHALMCRTHCKHLSIRMDGLRYSWDLAETFYAIPFQKS